VTTTAIAPPFILTRLSVLFFLQFFIWGAWYLTGFRYMIAHEMSHNAFWLYTASPLGAIIAPFFLGLCVDRFFNTEKVLAFCFLLGGAIMWCLPWIGDVGGTPVMQMGADGKETTAYYTLTLAGITMDKSAWFNLGIFAHMLCYMPTLALTAALAFRHLPRGNEQYPLVRLWGTFGWIAGGFVLAAAFTTTGEGGKLIEAGEKPVQFQLAAIACFLVGILCLTLPRTPAPKKGQPFSWRCLFFADAWQEWRNPAFATYLICAFLVCIPLSAYYAYLGNQMGAMALSHASIWGNVGTWLEAGMLFLMPWFIRKLGIKKMIMCGILAWVVRYLLFTWAASQGAVPAPFLADGVSINPAYPGVVIGGFPIPLAHVGFLVFLLGVALHGISYDFFFITGQVYVDKVTSPQIRGQAQAMNLFFTYGLGLYVGAIVAGTLAGKAFTDAKGAAVVAAAPESLPYWSGLWLPLAGFATVVLIIFTVAFRYREAPASAG
jgi:MFS family permease